MLSQSLPLCWPELFFIRIHLTLFVTAYNKKKKQSAKIPLSYSMIFIKNFVSFFCEVLLGPLQCSGEAFSIMMCYPARERFACGLNDRQGPCPPPQGVFLWNINHCFLWGNTYRFTPKLACVSLLMHTAWLGLTLFSLLTGFD